MKIELDREDIEAILIAHVREKFTPSINSVRWDGYNYPRSATFQHVDPEVPEAPKEGAAE